MEGQGLGLLQKEILEFQALLQMCTVLERFSIISQHVNNPPAIISTAEKDEMISSGRPIWLAELMIKSSWPRHQERIQTVKAFLGVLENQGESPAVEQPAESDDFTTWG